VYCRDENPEATSKANGVPFAACPKFVCKRFNDTLKVSLVGPCTETVGVYNDKRSSDVAADATINANIASIVNTNPL
jgi:hypothetical protein